MLTPLMEGRPQLVAIVHALMQQLYTTNCIACGCFDQAVSMHVHGMIVDCVQMPFNG